MSKLARASKILKEQRIFTVQGWLIDGVQDNLMLRQMKTEWGLSLVQARRYLKEAYGNWKTDKQISIEDKRAAKIAELKQDKRSLRPEFRGTPSGLNSLARIEKLIIRLEGLEQPIKHQVEATLNYKPIWGKIDPLLDDKADDSS